MCLLLLIQSITLKARDLFKMLLEEITLDEPHDELSEMVYSIMENRIGISKAKILANAEIRNPPDFGESIRRINSHEPVQYIVGKADFFGRSFKVNPKVLIPRPETEQLVSVALRYVQSNQKILDIGTGSGCIPITLALELSCEVTGTDISHAALEIARENASRLGAGVAFLQHDILHQELPLKGLDLIVSNPPYVTELDRSTMKRNVIDYEPHEALFVSNQAPLIFYEAIANKSRPALNERGRVLVEINEQFGTETAAVFRQFGFSAAEIMKDINRKDRFVLATL